MALEEEVVWMTTIPHEPSRVLAVLFDAVFGPDIVNTSAGGDQSSVPSVVPVAVFAFFATWVVAKYGFRREQKS